MVMDVDRGLVLDSLDVLERLYDESADESDKEFLQTLGCGVYNAKRRAAIYATQREVEYLTEYRTEERWTKLRSRLNDNSQTVFNHGDGGLENSIILLTKGVYQEMTVDLALLLMRDENNFFFTGFRSIRGTDDIGGLPFVMFKRNVSGAKIATWTLAPEAPTEQEGVITMALCGGSLCYLNDVIAVEKETGTYGDGVVYESIFSSDMLGPPAWLRKK